MPFSVPPRETPSSQALRLPLMTTRTVFYTLQPNFSTGLFLVLCFSAFWTSPLPFPSHFRIALLNLSSLQNLKNHCMWFFLLQAWELLGVEVKQTSAGSTWVSTKWLLCMLCVQQDEIDLAWFPIGISRG